MLDQRYLVRFVQFNVKVFFKGIKPLRQLSFTLVIPPVE